AELLLAGEVLGGERLVDLDQVEVGLLEAGPGEGAADRRDRADAHDRGLDAGDVPLDHAGQRGEVVALYRLFAGDDQRAAAVADARRVARGDDAALLERGRQFGHRLEVGLAARVFVGGELGHALLRLDLDRGEL